MSSPDEVVLVTGAAGRIGTSVATRLARPSRELRLLDTREPKGLPGWWISGSVTDRMVLRRGLEGADAVVHFAGIPSEQSWVDLLNVNISGTQLVLEEAHRAGVRTVFLASSIHVLGYAAGVDAAREQVLAPRPDTFYGVSKAAVEALGSVFADRFAMTIVSARIGAFGPAPANELALATWISEPDMARLVEASLRLTRLGHHIVWGVSDNEPGWFPLQPGFAIGFFPQDDAVAFVTAQTGERPTMPEVAALLGGEFIDDRHPLGAPAI